MLKLKKSFVLCFLLVIGAYAQRDPLEDLFDPFNIRHWTLRNTGPFLQDSKLSSRETKDSDKDREPLAPDYKDPIPGASEDKPSVEKKPNGFDPSVLPGGVIDVDAGGSGLPSAFPNVHNFGFSSSFGGNGGGLFGLGGFFGGALPEIKPWWKGENVCIEREETTDDDDNSSEKNSDDEDKKNETESVPNFFQTSISLSNCFQTPNKYECVTKVNNHGVVKTFTVRYKCCYGFQREDNSPGCTKQVDLKPLLETIEEVDGKEFTNMISSSGLANKVKTENLTIFVPHDAALSEFNENMVDMNKVEYEVDSVRRRRAVKSAVSTQDLILNHMVKGFVDMNDISNEEVLYNENNNKTIRMNVYPTKNFGKMITANCARVKKGNNLAENGIVHVVDGVVAPALQSIQEIITESKKLTNLKRVLQSTDLDKYFKEDGHYTIFAPTDEAFNKLDEMFKQKILNGEACAASILKHHIVSHTICSSAIIGNASVHNIEGERLSLERKDNDEVTLEENSVITQADIIATNGVIHLIDTILIPDSALHITEALKKRNNTKFENLIEQAGLAEEFDGMKNATVFVPSDDAFNDEETKKYLNEIKDDKEKLKNVVMYHTVQGQVQTCDLENNKMFETKLPGKSLRVNLYSTLPLFTNIVNKATVNCARMTDFDEKTCGSTIQQVDRILMPPEKNILDTIENDEKFSILKKILKGTEVEKILQENNQSITLLAPDNEAFEGVNEDDMKTLMEDKEKANAVLKNHVLTEVLCCSGVGPQSWGFATLVSTLSESPLQVSRSGPHQIRIGRALVTKCDTLATNGLVHTINRVLFPYRAQRPSFGGFFLFDI